ncbi:restriction endonuclease subunit S [Ktedonobacteria bacterium brp13]|nr:restriction endonuclease subunit S [Ktedonobacteria bacterium brp13]
MEEKLPEGWVLVKIDDLAEIIGGSTPSRTEKDYFGGDIIWLTPTEIPKETVSYITTSREKLTREGFNASGVRWIPEGSVLLTSRASIGYVGIAGTQLTTNQGFASFVIFGGFNSKYFAWWIKSQKNALESLAGGTTFKEISKTVLKEILVPIAPVPEQRRIVAAIEQQFTRLDDAVDSLKKAQAKVKQYRASLLKSAVEGELTREWRTINPASETGEQLLKRILEERRARWEEAELAKMQEKGITPIDDKWKLRYKEPQEPDVEKLPELPEGWCWATVEQICDQIVDCLHSTPKFTENGFLCVDTNCIKPGKIILEKARYVDQDTFFERNRRMRPKKDDVIFSREGALLGIAVRISENMDFCLGQRMMAFRLHQSINAKYYENILNSIIFRTQYQSKITGTASPHLNIEDIRNFAIPLASLQEQYSIVLEIERNLSVADIQEENIEKSLKRADHERQSILHEAFAGRLVPQDLEDEPASILLERIREERKRREEAEKAVKVSRRGSRMSDSRGRQNKQTANGKGKIGLYDRLLEKQPLSPEELFRQAGLNADDQHESVEAFYEELSLYEAAGGIKDSKVDSTVLLEAVALSDEALARIEGEKESIELTVQTYEKDEEEELEGQETYIHDDEQGDNTVNQSTLWDM